MRTGAGDGLNAMQTRDGFSWSRWRTYVSYVATQHVPRAFVHGAPIDPRDRATLCAPQKQNEALRFGPGGLRPSPLDATVEHGTRQLVGTRNPRARINSCFARLSTIWKIYPIHHRAPRLAIDLSSRTNNECLQRYVSS